MGKIVEIPIHSLSLGNELFDPESIPTKTEIQVPQYSELLSVFCRKTYLKNGNDFEISAYARVDDPSDDWLWLCEKDAPQKKVKKSVYLIPPGMKFSHGDSVGCRFLNTFSVQVTGPHGVPEHVYHAFVRIC